MDIDTLCYQMTSPFHFDEINRFVWERMLFSFKKWSALKTGKG